MRYDDWDVLLFPSGRDVKVPLREFKVNCHAIPDAEFAHNRGAFGLPAMTCFVPSLQPGAQFQISIHCWGTPQLSQHALNYSKHPELVKFEARILIDGRMVASTSFEPFGQWPHLITTTCEMSKQGELEPLKFPSFRRELLYQNHWNPGDDIGRIKIIISEGFPRDSPSNPVERVKNVVAFSFQHAPLDILETNGIAWPNPQMWRRPQNNPAIPVPTYYPEDGADSHLHSPRRKSYVGRSSGSSGVPMSDISGALADQVAANFPHNMPTLRKNSGVSVPGSMDPFSEAAYQEWVSSMGLQAHIQQTVEPKAIWTSAVHQNSSRLLDNGTSMSSLPDYLVSTMTQGVGSDPMGISVPNLDDGNIMESFKVPTNTPTTFTSGDHAASGQFDYEIANTAISGELAGSLTHSLLNQPHPLGASQSAQPHQIPLPASEVRSRKENRHLNNASSADSPSSNPSPSAEAQIRKFSQTSNAFGVIGSDRDSSGSGAAYSRRTSAGEFGANITNQATPNQTYAGVAASGTGPGYDSEKGTKRGRNFTPASSKAIDEEDEPRRLSPRLRVPSAVPADGPAQVQAEE